jgi:hypothetical protein
MHANLIFFQTTQLHPNELRSCSMHMKMGSHRGQELQHTPYQVKNSVALSRFDGPFVKEGLIERRFFQGCTCVARSVEHRSGMDEALAGVGRNAGLLCYGWHQSLFSY